MPVNLVAEEEIRAALRRHRVDPETFAAGVRTRLQIAQLQQADDPLAGRSPLLRSAAAFLPLAILSGCKAAPAAAKAAPAGIAYKLLGYVTFPAISLFVLLGAAAFSVAKIRGLRENTTTRLADQQAIEAVIRQWWHQHRWGASGVFAASLALAMIGASWLLFLSYIVSLGILLYVLTALARLGLGNRQVIGRSCVLGLSVLGQVAGFAGIGHQDIHFVDQSLVVVVFFGGVLILLVSLFYLSKYDGVKLTDGPQGLSAVAATVILIPLLLWLASPVLWSPGPTQIKHFVESFDNAPYEMVSWQQWEIPAQWAVDAKLNPDWTRPRRLLDTELAGDQNSFILATALRVGLLPAGRLGELRNHQESWEFLITPPPQGMKPLPITFLPEADWVIRAAVLRNDLSHEERDLLEKRLHATLDEMLISPLSQLETVLHVTQLLNVIGRPIDRDEYRERVHSLMREFHSTNTGGFQVAGGFRTYRNDAVKSWRAPPGALEPTSHAVELMQIYGVPEGLDLNWVRSFLKPMVLRFSNDKWMAAATLDRLNHLPGVTPPSWLEFLYYERTLLAAVVLVGLCLYATACSPNLKAVEQADAGVSAG